MKIALHTPARKRTVAAFVIALATLYTGATAREFFATWLGNRPELTSLKRAAWLDSGNAEYRNHLGRYYDFVARDPATALEHYRAAVALNPHSASFWLDLAGAYQIMGDTANQTAALARAIQADPMTPDVAWDAANFYLVQGENEKALREFRIVMANEDDSSLVAMAVQFCWRIEPDVGALLRDAVPQNANAYIAFLTLFEQDVDLLLGKIAKPDADADVDVALLTQQINQETAGTFKIWDALIRSNQPFEKRYVYDYIRFLIQRREVDEAVTVWRQAAGRFGLSAYLPSPSNLIVNGTFNLDVLNGGFDWQYQKQSTVTLAFDPTDFHAGRRSLSITFDGPGISDAGLYQLIAVQPNTTYQLSAFYKSGELEGAGGLHLTVQDVYSPAVYYDSDELKEAGFWKSLDGEFTTGSDCKLVMLHVRRLPAGSPIRGKLWIDDFHLVKKTS
jgi:tetratricopeptide (TPR) repeat protein